MTLSGQRSRARTRCRATSPFHPVSPSNIPVAVAISVQQAQQVLLPFFYPTISFVHQGGLPISNPLRYRWAGDQKALPRSSVHLFLPSCCLPAYYDTVQVLTYNCKTVRWCGSGNAGKSQPERWWACVLETVGLGLVLPKRDTHGPAGQSVNPRLHSNLLLSSSYPLAGSLMPERLRMPCDLTVQ